MRTQIIYHKGQILFDLETGEKLRCTTCEKMIEGETALLTVDNSTVMEVQHKACSEGHR